MNYKRMTIEEMRERKKEQNYTCEKLAELAGLSVDVVRQTMTGGSSAADENVLTALDQVLASRPVNVVREAQAVYLTEKEQGEFTIEDYYFISAKRRVELIDGVIYDMASPSLLHQMMSGKIYRIIADYIDSNKGQCIPAAAPVDVQLDCDEKTVLQPDIMILCDRKKITEKRIIFGAPDFVLEILSKSTRKKDMTKKLQKYADAGVREYWIVDPEQKKVMVYEFADKCEKKLIIFGFTDKVPIKIFNGDCVVDFNKVYEYVEFLYER